MDKKKIGFVICFFTVLFWMVQQSETIDSFIQHTRVIHGGDGAVSGAPGSLFSDAGENERLWLRRAIQEEAKRQRIAPINAIVDSVWKAIPGLNGLEVDVDQTYKLALESNTVDGKSLAGIPFVYRETAPQISLEDLGPQPIYKGNAKKPMVSIMINVAWGNEYIPEIIRILNEENVHATFFLDGSWLRKNADIAHGIAIHGHELANHAYSHKNMSQLSRTKAREEMVKTQELLKRMNVDNQLFAPPSGDFDQETVDIAHELGMRTILWTLDTVDWRNPSPEWIVRKISQRVEPGALILMHPTSSSSAALKPMIRKIKQKGLALGTVSELISASRVPNVERGQDF